jgi:transposase InsO family protein
VRRLMKAAGIAGIRPRRFRKTTDSAHALPIAKNVLARSFDVTRIARTNSVWAGDITYVELVPISRTRCYAAIGSDHSNSSGLT